jgi:GAF domain-containing protein
MSEMVAENYKQVVDAQAQALLALVHAANQGEFDTPIQIPEGDTALSDLATGLQTMMAELRVLRAEHAQHELIEQQGQALLEAIQWVAMGNMDIEIQIPEGESILSDLAIGLGIMVDDLKMMMSQQVRADLVEAQSQALLDVVQSVALGELDVEVNVPEGVEVLSELAVGMEMMLDDLRDIMAEQERARAEIEAGRQQLEVALQDVLAVQRRYLQQEWTRYTAEEQAPGYQHSAEEEGPSTDAWLPGMTAAVQRAQLVTDGHSAGEAILAIPIKLYGQVIGTIGFSREGNTSWTREELEAAETIVEQVGWALESQRLLDEEQQARSLLIMRVNELDCLNEIGRKMDELPDISELLPWVAERIPTAMSYPDLSLTAIELEGQVYGDAEAPNLPCQMVQNIHVGGQAVGRITIAYSQEMEFLDEESALLGDIARRVSGYVENRRLLQEIRGRAEELAVLNDLARALTARLDVDQVLHETHQGVSRLLDARNFYIGLYDPASHKVSFALNISDSPVEQNITTISADEGLTGYIVRTRQPVLIRGNYADWLAERGLALLGEPAASWLGVPLLIGDQALGVMAIQSFEISNLYDEHDRDLFVAIANQAAIAIQNARLFEQTQTHAEELAVLNDLARALSTRLDVDQVLRETYQGVSRLLDARNFYVGLYDPARHTISFRLNITESVVDQEIVSISADQGISGYIVRTRQPVLIRENIPAWHVQVGLQQVGEPAASWLGVPLLIGDQVLGVMAAQSYTTPRLYDEHDRDLLTAIAGQAAIALQNARLFEQTQTALNETATLYRVAQSLAQAQSQQEMFESVLVEYLRTLGLSQGGVMTLDKDGKQATLHALVQNGQLVEAGLRIPIEGNRPTERALATQQPVAIRDALHDELTASTADLVEQLGYKSLLLVPIIVRGEAVGLLGADSVDAIHDFTEREIGLVRAVADQLGIAMENQRLLEEMQLSLAETEALYRVTSSVAAFQALSETLQTVVDSVAVALPADRVAMYIVDLEAKIVTSFVGGGPGGLLVDPLNFEELWGGLSGWVLREHQPALSPKNQIDEREGPQAQKRRAAHESGSIIVVPMQYRGRILGTLTAVNRMDQPDFAQRDVDLLLTMASQAAAALENARLFEETRLRAEQQATLNEVGQILTSCQDIASVLDEAYAGAHRLLDVSDFYITLYDAAQDEINFALRAVDNQVDRPLTVQPVGRGGMSDYLIRTRQPLLLVDHVAERVAELGIAHIPLTPGRVSQSWLGVPMMVGDRVVGTMVTLSYTTPRAFDERSRDLLIALANQTALALENVRLLAETRAALVEVEATHQGYLRRAWQDHLRQRDMLARSGFLFDRTQVDREQAMVAAPDLWRPEMERVLQESAPATTNSGDGEEQRAGMAIPIHVRGQTIGVLGVETPSGDRQWTEDDRALLAAVSDQLGQTLETARLFADTQRRAERERLIGEITARIRASTDMRDILETAATELGQALGTSRTFVRVGLEDLEAQRRQAPAAEEG